MNPPLGLVDEETISAMMCNMSLDDIGVLVRPTVSCHLHVVCSVPLSKSIIKYVCVCVRACMCVCVCVCVCV